MPNPKKRSRAWILLALLPVCATAVFFSMRALSRTPAKIDPEKLVKVERIDLARSVVATGKIEPTTKVMATTWMLSMAGNSHEDSLIAIAGEVCSSHDRKWSNTG